MRIIAIVPQVLARIINLKIFADKFCQEMFFLLSYNLLNKISFSFMSKNNDHI